MMNENTLRARPGAHHVFRDQSQLVTRPDGSVQDDGLDGFYYANTRMLSRFVLTVNGHPLLPVQVHPARDDVLVACYQDPHITGDAVLQDRALLLQATFTIGAGLHIDLDARNCSLLPIEGELVAELDADFADLEEARQGQDASKIMAASEERGEERSTGARRTCLLDQGGGLRFDSTHPELHEATALSFAPAPTCTERGVAWPLALPPQGTWHACLSLAPVHRGQEIAPTARCYGAWTDTADPATTWTERATSVRTPNDTVRRAYDRGVSDLAAMALRDGPRREHPAFAAGIPNYQNVFGRDILTAGWQAAMASRSLMESAILLCERTQGRVRDDFRDEQPGRIIQQLRTGPLNLLNKNPRARYYSDYASPGDFLIAIGQHFMWTGDRAFLRARLPAAQRVLHWLDHEADLDGDGLYEYQTRSPQGDRNQGWKDSEHGIPHLDGSDAPLPVAASDVQALVYAGKQQLGWSLLLLGKVRWGLRLVAEAEALKRRFNERFWMPDEHFPAMALDGQKRQVRSIGSNAGLCLAAGIIGAEHARDVAGRLLSSELFSGWGVRTLSERHIAYNPLGYHLGTVWPVEQGSIAFGLKRYGFGGMANDVARGMFDLVSMYQLHRLPEAVGGFPRDRQHPFPAIYPQACWPQAWSASAVILLLQAMLGLRPIAPLGVLLIYPELPEWLPDLTLRGLRVGNSSLTIRFYRDGSGGTDYEVLERKGHVRVIRAAPDNTVRHGLPRRVGEPLLGLLAHGW